MEEKEITVMGEEERETLPSETEEKGEESRREQAEEGEGETAETFGESEEGKEESAVKADEEKEDAAAVLFEEIPTLQAEENGATAGEETPAPEEDAALLEGMFGLPKGSAKPLLTPRYRRLRQLGLTPAEAFAAAHAEDGTGRLPHGGKAHLLGVAKKAGSAAPPMMREDEREMMRAFFPGDTEEATLETYWRRAL